MAKVDISSYSGSVSGTNWTPALAAAFLAVDNDGGTINFNNDVQLESKFSANATAHYTPLILQGDGGSRVTIKVPADFGIYVNANVLRSDLRDLNFIGNAISDDEDPDYFSAGAAAVLLGALDRNIVERCVFGGLAADSDTGAILYLYHSNNTVIDSKFGGNSAKNVLYGDGVYDLTVKRCEFFDYQNFRGTYYDKPVPRDCWIKVENPPSAVTANTGLVRIENCRFDEGANKAVDIEGYAVNIDGVRVNMNGGSDGAIVLTDVPYGEIKNSWFGYSDQDVPAIKLTNCGDITIEGIQRHGGVKRVEADKTTRVKLINCPGLILERV